MSAGVAVAVLATGGVAAVARFAVAAAWRESRHARPDAFPLPVLVVNVVGSLVAGVALRLGVDGTISDGVRLVLLTGCAGGLTTFSTWLVEAWQHHRADRTRVAVLVVVVNLVLGLAAAGLGWVLAGV